MSIELLPTVILKYLSFFFDFESFVNFSLTNKRHLKMFSHVPTIYKMIKGYLPKIKLNLKLDKIIEHLKGRGINLLLKCCENRKMSIEMIKCLIENNSDLNVIDKSTKNTPFHNSCRNKKVNFEIIKFLAENKAELNFINQNSKKTPLHCLSSNKSTCFQSLQYFVEKKGDLNMKDSFKRTPFHFICRYGSIEKIKFFSKKKNFHNFFFLHFYIFFI